MLQVQRKTLAGTSTAYEFTREGLKFLVKNLSDNDCYANIVPITNDNESISILIPKKTAQVVFTDEVNCYPTDTLYVKGTGDVEVQILLCK